MADNLFEEIKSGLSEFKGFLDGNMGPLKTAVELLSEPVPQIKELIGQLKGLLISLKDEIGKLDIGALGDALGIATEFTSGVKGLLETAKGLLPGQAEAIDGVLAVANVVGSLPGLEEIKEEIFSLIDAIVGSLNELSA